MIDPERRHGGIRFEYSNGITADKDDKDTRTTIISVFGDFNIQTDIYQSARAGDT